MEFLRFAVSIALASLPCVGLHWASPSNASHVEKAQPMRPLTSLTLEAMIALLSDTFGRLANPRRPDRVDYSLHDTLLSGFAMMFFQYPSLLEFQRKMKQRRGRCNLETIFGVTQVPSDTQMRAILDGVAPELLRSLLPVLFEKIRRAGWATSQKYRAKWRAPRRLLYADARWDRLFSFHCSPVSRLFATARWGWSSAFPPYGSVGNAVKAGAHRVFPLDVEEVRNSDGQEKQDCELQAAKRLMHRLRQEHPQMALLVGGDDLYCHEPFIVQLRQQPLHHVLVCKPDSHREVYTWVADLSTCPPVRRQWHEGPACRRRFSPTVSRVRSP